MCNPNHRFAPTETMPWGNITGVSTLLQELLNHAEGHAEAVSNLRASALVVVVGRKDSFTQIQRQCAHDQTLPRVFTNGYTIY